MNILQELIDQFDNSTFSLSREDILELDKEDNGPINNVVRGILPHCYGVRLFEEENFHAVEMFFVHNNRELAGYLIQISLDDKNYFQLLIKFCGMLANECQVDTIAAFNTFQMKVRDFLEKLGYFTTTSIELKPYKGKNAVMFRPFGTRGIKNIILIEHTDFYREFFKGIFALEITKGSEYVYLMVNSRNGHIKIGTSTNPRYREKTLQSEEPKIGIIAIWRCNKKIEKELHDMFKDKRIRGEWFKLNFRDLKDIEEYMMPYSTK